MGAAIGTAIGVVGGIQKINEGKAMQRFARQQIENFKWQDLQNPFEGMAPSTLGANLRAEESARATATAIEAGRAGGIRGAAAITGRALLANNSVNRESAADLDRQRLSIDMASAGQEVRNQEMIESRQVNELAGYGQMMNVGMGMKYQGFGDLVNAGFSLDESARGWMKLAGGGSGGGEV
jgi:hypothetical protein